MPFTFTHPAIVLPLKKVFGKWVSFTGLVIGSLTPDFEYFFRMKIQSEYSHTIIGTLWFNLPLGILLTFVFHQIIKKPLIENSPKIIQERLVSLKNFNWKNYFNKNWLKVCISIIIGAYSHILWDSFTHRNAYLVEYLQLNNQIESLGIPYFKLLQHLSSLIGGIIILWYFLRIEKNEKTYNKPKSSYWVVIGILTVCILLLKFITNLKISEYGNVIVSGISALMISTTIISGYEMKKTSGNTS